MGWIRDKYNSLVRKTTQTATNEAKAEVRKSLVDLIPGVLTVGTIIIGILTFRENIYSYTNINKPTRPYDNGANYITNNYFFCNLSEDTIRSIVGGKKR